MTLSYSMNPTRIFKNFFSAVLITIGHVMYIGRSCTVFYTTPLGRDIPS
jgi:hypothetical protein